MESFAVGYITPRRSEKRQVGLSLLKPASTRLLLKPTEKPPRHEDLLLGPGFSAAWCSLDRSPGQVLPQHLQHMLLPQDVPPRQNPCVCHQKPQDNVTHLLPQSGAHRAKEGEKSLRGPPGTLVPELPAEEAADPTKTLTCSLFIALNNLCFPMFGLLSPHLLRSSCTRRWTLLCLCSSNSIKHLALTCTSAWLK